MVTKKYIKDGIIKNAHEIIIRELGSILEDGTQLYRYHTAKNEEEILNNNWVLYEDLEELRQEKLSDIAYYDKSLNVNSFYVNGLLAWIDRDTRVSLMNSTQILKNSGQNSTTLWLNGNSFTIPCENLMQMLGALEIYALQCYNVTELHKANINNLQTVEDIKQYNYTVEYPEKLIFTV